MVMVSETMVLDGKPMDRKTMAEHIAKWATVTVDDGTDTVILTGMVDESYFPPYVFTSSRITGEPGKEYTLSVDYKDYHAEARTSIPAPVPIDTLYSRVLKDSVYTVVCGFTDPPGKGDRYKVFTRTVGRDSRYLPSTVAIASDEVFDGYSEIVLWSAQRLMEPLYQPDIRLGDEMWVKLCTMDERTFNFWSNYEVTLATNTNAMYWFDSDVSANMRGALGYWAGYGVSEGFVTVGE